MLVQKAFMILMIIIYLLIFLIPRLAITSYKYLQ